MRSVMLVLSALVSLLPLPPRRTSAEPLAGSTAVIAPSRRSDLVVVTYREMLGEIDYGFGSSPRTRASAISSAAAPTSFRRDLLELAPRCFRQRRERERHDDERHQHPGDRGGVAASEREEPPLEGEA